MPFQLPFLTILSCEFLGWILVKGAPNTPAVEYDDAAHWEAEYLDCEGIFEDKSNHSHGSILPVIKDHSEAPSA